jgi:hypothetical protein
VEEPGSHNQEPYHLTWDYRPTVAKDVDLTGGLWFLRKDWLHIMWRDHPFTLETGEDFQLTYALRKYAGLPTHLLPVHDGDAETWPHSPDYFDVAKGTESTNGRLWDMRPIIYFNMMQVRRSCSIEAQLLLYECAYWFDRLPSHNYCPSLRPAFPA